MYSNFDMLDVYFFLKRFFYFGIIWGFFVIYNRVRMMKMIRIMVFWNLKYVVRRKFDVLYSYKNGYFLYKIVLIY